MTSKQKTAFLVVVIAIVGVFLLRPYLWPADEEFATTENPLTVFEEARAQGKPIFMEFYSAG